MARGEDVFVIVLHFPASQPNPALVSLLGQVTIQHPYLGLSHGIFFFNFMAPNLGTTDL